jgi:hypothetical protein
MVIGKIRTRAMHRIAGVAFMVALFNVAAQAQSPVIQGGIRPQLEGGAYCSFGATLESGNQPAEAATVFQRCAPGDSIILPVTYPQLIAEVCDFSRSIANLPRAVACIVGAPRAIR